MRSGLSAGSFLIASFFFGLLFLILTRVRKALRHQKTPDGLVSVEVLAGLSDLLFHLILLAARPGVAAAFDVVEHDLRALLAAIVGIHFCFHSAFFVSGQFGLRRFLRTAVDSGPGLGAVVYGDGL